MRFFYTFLLDTQYHGAQLKRACFGEQFQMKLFVIRNIQYGWCCQIENILSHLRFFSAEDRKAAMHITTSSFYKQNNCLRLFIKE